MNEPRQAVGKLEVVFFVVVVVVVVVAVVVVVVAAAAAAITHIDFFRTRNVFG